MEQKTSMITLKEASEKTGISRQTITNWIDGGVIPGIRTGNSVWVSSASVDEMCRNDFPMLNGEMELLKARIDEKRMDLTALEDRTEEALRKCASILQGCSESAVRRELSRLFAHMAGKMLDDREKKILSMFMEGQPVSEISEQYSLTRTRIMQIVARSLRKISGAETLIDENDRLSEENKELMKQNSMLKSAYGIVRKKLGELNASPKTEDGHDSKIIAALDTPCSELRNVISVRALNTLMNIGGPSFTIGDLLDGFSVSDLMKCNHCGRKTVNEIVEYVESRGLSFGMDVKAARMVVADRVAT